MDWNQYADPAGGQAAQPAAAPAQQPQQPQNTNYQGGGQAQNPFESQGRPVAPDNRPPANNAPQGGGYSSDRYQGGQSEPRRQEEAYAGNQGGQNNGYQQQRPNNNGYQQGGGHQQRSGGDRQGGYQGGSGGYAGRGGNGGGGYQGGGGGGGGKFPQRRVLSPQELAEYKCYKTVVISGNDEPPAQVVEILSKLIPEIHAQGFVVRSGGMKGLENEVERFVDRNMFELHLPWRDFDQKQSKFTWSPDEAKEIARRAFPGPWENLKPAIQGFYAKNARLVFGKDMKSPTQLAIIWSEDGAEMARERTARSNMAGHILALAHELRIPVVNLQRPDAVQRIQAFLHRQA